MPSRFEGFLKKYTNHSDRIESINETDFINFSIENGDRVLVWDKKRHVSVMNRHNYALLFWMDYFLNSRTSPDVIHVDGHRDDDKPENRFDRSKSSSIKYIAKYIDSLHIERFIVPAKRNGIVSDVEFFGDLNNFGNLEKTVKYAANNPVIFDLDLDVYTNSPFIIQEYSRESERIRGLSHRDSYMVFAKLIQHSELTTISFSPDYLKNRKEEVKQHFNRIWEAYNKVEPNKNLFSKITDIIF